ncbi:hypothetical protein P7K49_002265, partial [Saguinus oedipus]
PKNPGEKQRVCQRQAGSAGATQRPRSARAGGADSLRWSLGVVPQEGGLGQLSAAPRNREPATRSPSTKPSQTRLAPRTR